MTLRFSPKLFWLALLASGSLACAVSDAIANLNPLAGKAYWAAVTETAVPTVTVFLGWTTPVYAATLPPDLITTTPEWTTVTPAALSTPTPYWVTTTPMMITTTPPAPVTTTPELPMIGFTTPVPAATPYYRVGTFYMNQDIHIGYPNSVVIRLTDYELRPSATNPETDSYLLLYVTIKNYSGSDTFVPVSDIFFVREVRTDAALRRRWSAKNEPLGELGLPSYDDQLLNNAGEPAPIPPETERDYIVAFILPQGTIGEVGVTTDLRRPVDGGIPLWIYLQEDPLGPFQEPCGPPTGYYPGCQPLPPTPIIFDENDAYGGPGATVEPPPGIGSWPTNGIVVRGFGCQEFYTGVDGAGFGCPPERPWFHNGVDIANATGNPIYAVIDGTVEFASYNPNAPDCAAMAGSEPPHQGLGYYQRITDGTLLHYYGHLSAFVVTGGPVTNGQQVALMGSTGCSAGPHLHWTLFSGGNLIDPETWAGPGPPP
jgi:hypothetical protein